MNKGARNGDLQPLGTDGGDRRRLLALTFNLYEQGWDTHHWLYLILAPLWVYFIVELYRTDWDNQD